jgi:hypothetical protein
MGTIFLPKKPEDKDIGNKTYYGFAEGRIIGGLQNEWE